MNSLRDILKIEHPIIMAPMFPVTNIKMMVAALRSGIAGCIPAHNFRSLKGLREGLQEIRQATEGALGVNIILHRSNPFWKRELEASLEAGIDFLITSLGSPAEVVKRAHQKNVLVFCDVVSQSHAKKAVSSGANGLIAVTAGAGGHAGPLASSVLIPLLREKFDLPIVAAGGVGDRKGVETMLGLGASGVSVGTPFIATHEADVSIEYKQAIVDYGSQDIIMTSKLSGTPCSVINTPYVMSMGVKENFLEALLNKNKVLKKQLKKLTAYRGFKSLERAAFKATYKKVWCAGKSLEFVKKIQSVNELVKQLTE